VAKRQHSFARSTKSLSIMKIPRCTVAAQEQSAKIAKVPSNPGGHFGQLAGDLSQALDQPIGRHAVCVRRESDAHPPLRSLGAQGYADVTAHILATNGFPNGQQGLSPDDAVLDRIPIDRKR
jgi:hypothetical protein